MWAGWCSFKFCQDESQKHFPRENDERRTTKFHRPTFCGFWQNGGNGMIMKKGTLIRSNQNGRGFNFLVMIPTPVDTVNAERLQQWTPPHRSRLNLQNFNILKVFVFGSDLCRCYSWRVITDNHDVISVKFLAIYDAQNNIENMRQLLFIVSCDTSICYCEQTHVTV